MLAERIWPQKRATSLGRIESLCFPKKGDTGSYLSSKAISACASFDSVSFNPIFTPLPFGLQTSPRQPLPFLVKTNGDCPTKKQDLRHDSPASIGVPAHISLSQVRENRVELRWFGHGDDKSLREVIAAIAPHTMSVDISPRTLSHTICLQTRTLLRFSPC